MNVRFFSPLLECACVSPTALLSLLLPLHSVLRGRLLNFFILCPTGPAYYQSRGDIKRWDPTKLSSDVGMYLSFRLSRFAC
jgi:hypothetical protein